MSTSYTPYYPNGWVNEETQTTTPICAEALNNIETGISANAEAIAALEGGGGGGSGPSPYTSNPAALGSASPGSSAQYSRGDHVHPLPAAATTSAAGLMSAQDKGRLDDLYADYSSALTALG